VWDERGECYSRHEFAGRDVGEESLCRLGKSGEFCGAEESWGLEEDDGVWFLEMS